jgi:hypothetical protein
MKTLFHYMLALMMLVTGSINTLSEWYTSTESTEYYLLVIFRTRHVRFAAVKAADKVKAVGRTTDGYTEEPREFAHPLYVWCFTQISRGGTFVFFCVVSKLGSCFWARRCAWLPSMRCFFGIAANRK